MCVTTGRLPKIPFNVRYRTRKAKHYGADLAENEDLFALVADFAASQQPRLNKSCVFIASFAKIATNKLPKPFPPGNWHGGTKVLRVARQGRI